ncbi:MAG: hypothetical protein JST55_09570 [Bacteroidetes bacterium]|nr:hypothetical protein [Bacteroidota bacterium]
MLKRTTVKARIEVLEKKIDALYKLDKKKDWWDKLNSISSLISGGIIGLIALVFTISYNSNQLDLQKQNYENQNQIQKIDVTDKFIKYLNSTNVSEREMGYEAYRMLGYEDLAIKYIETNNDSSGIPFLKNIIKNSNDSLKKEKLFEVIANIHNTMFKTLVTFPRYKINRKYYDKGLYKKRVERCLRILLYRETSDSTYLLNNFKLTNILEKNDAKIEDANDNYYSPYTRTPLWILVDVYTKIVNWNMWYGAGVQLKFIDPKSELNEKNWIAAYVKECLRYYEHPNNDRNIKIKENLNCLYYLYLTENWTLNDLYTDYGPCGDERVFW